MIGMGTQIPYLPTAILLGPNTRMVNYVYYGPRTDRACNSCRTIPDLIARVQKKSIKQKIDENDMRGCLNNWDEVEDDEMTG